MATLQVALAKTRKARLTRDGQTTIVVLRFWENRVARGESVKILRSGRSEPSKYPSLGVAEYALGGLAHADDWVAIRTIYS